MKKNFEQPKLMVVRMNNNDIVTTSDQFTLDTNSDHSITIQYGADRFRDDWDAGY